MVVVLTVVFFLSLVYFSLCSGWDSGASPVEQLYVAGNLKSSCWGLSWAFCSESLWQGCEKVHSCKIFLLELKEW